MHKLFVSGFPLEMPELELAKLIAPYGDIATIKIVRDRKTRICKGYAFVEMHSAQDAVNVREALNETEMEGRQLTINVVEEEPAVSARKRPVLANQRTSPKYDKGEPPVFAGQQRVKRTRKTF